MGATAFLYSCGSYIELSQFPAKINALVNIEVNVIIIDGMQIISATHVRNFFSSLIKKFNPRSNPDPKPFIIVSNIPEPDVNDSTKSFTTLLYNSSIWFRYLNISKTIEDLTEPISNINIEIGQVIKEQSYQNINSKEYIDFHLRNQSVNYLQGSGHADYITPYIYSNELQRKLDTAIAQDLCFFFDENKENNDYKTKGIVLRILLIDDKIKVDAVESGENNHYECKAYIIKTLLELKFDQIKQKDVCWRTEDNDDAVKIYQNNCNAGCNGCIKKANIGIKKINEEIKINQGKIQIIAVSDITKARQLLACKELRFDLILMDYLLAEKHGDEKNREYATEFWGDGHEKYFEFSKDLEIKDQESIAKYGKLKPLYDIIKSNRGPMNRLWIFPITAFNQTFIDDLRNKGVRLIDHYWYLSRGADPINTPYQFLDSLNNFLQLQLRQAIFSMSMLIGFINRSLKQLESIKNADDFQAFMGPEYTVMMQKFGWRPVIYRDKEAGSLFAAYVWGNFYARE